MIEEKCGVRMSANRLSFLPARDSWRERGASAGEAVGRISGRKGRGRRPCRREKGERRPAALAAPARIGGEAAGRIDWRNGRGGRPPRQEKGDRRPTTLATPVREGRARRPCWREKGERLPVVPAGEGGNEASGRVGEKEGESLSSSPSETPSALSLSSSSLLRPLRFRPLRHPPLWRSLPSSTLHPRHSSPPAACQLCAPLLRSTQRHRPACPAHGMRERR